MSHKRVFLKVSDNIVDFRRMHNVEIKSGSCAGYSLLASFLLLGGILFGSASLAKEVPKPLVDKLKHEEFAMREKAQVELVEWAEKQGDAAKLSLYRLSKNSDQPEVRQRSYEVLRQLVDQEYEFSGDGYIGIFMDEVQNLNNEAAPKIKQAVLVTAVMNGHGAEAAGIQRNDMIVGIKGRKFPSGLNPESFKNVIMAKKPNDKVTLTFIRNNELKEAEITLGRRPVQVLDSRFGGRGRELQLEERAKDEFFKEWVEKNASK